MITLQTEQLISEMRKKIRHNLLDILGMFSFPRPGVHILNGHYIGMEEYDKDVFRELLNELSKIVRLIRIEDAIFMIRNLDKCEMDQCYVAFTFDDGFEECFTKIAPVLEEFKLNALFFIIPNFIDGDADYIKKMCNETLNMPIVKNPMTWEQVLNLSDRGFLIGSHTLNHHNLANCAQIDLYDEILLSQKIIAEKINKPCVHFAYPYGRLSDINKVSIDLANEHYLYCFTQSNYKRYFSFENTFINRRHFEGNWPVRYLKYFLSCRKK